jgi:hypothetical protein
MTLQCYVKPVGDNDAARAKPARKVALAFMTRKQATLSQITLSTANWSPRLLTRRRPYVEMLQNTRYLRSPEQGTLAMYGKQAWPCTGGVERGPGHVQQGTLAMYRTSRPLQVDRTVCGKVIAPVRSGHCDLRLCCPLSGHEGQHDLVSGLSPCCFIFLRLASHSIVKSFAQTEVSHAHDDDDDEENDEDDDDDDDE